MRHRMMSGVSVLVLSAGLLVAPMAGTAFAKGPKPPKGTTTTTGGGGGSTSTTGGGHGDPDSKACERAKAKLAKDTAKGKDDHKIAEDQKKVDKECGTASGGTTTTGGGGG